MASYHSSVTKIVKTSLLLLCQRMFNKLFTEAFVQAVFMKIYFSLSANPVPFIPQMKIFSCFDAVFTKTTQKTNMFHSKRISHGQVHRTDVVREVKLSLRKPVRICRNSSMACVNEQEAPEQTQTQKGSLQRVKARTGSLGEILRNFLSHQGSG